MEYDNNHFIIASRAYSLHIIVAKKVSLLLKFITDLGNFITNKSNLIMTEKAMQALGDTNPPKPRLASVERAKNLRVGGCGSLWLN
jgi:hypothetical protein